ncbi:hypothetical protein DXV76_03015 [Rhodobacteraceae bacterium CCMM004]|nr:hypothetical protein DXV76_03015 [Rhodobacteraceae bacterium CCMM004]
MWRTWLCLWLWAAVAAPAAAGGSAAALAQRMAERPDRVLEEAAALILGHGQDGLLGPDGVARHVAMVRARIRAREVRRLREADLDGDLQVSAEELAVVQSVSTPGVRGRLALAFADADRDGSGVADPAEIHDRAGRVAMKEVDAGDVAALMALLTLDGDGDGLLSLAEVVAAVATLRQET